MILEERLDEERVSINQSRFKIVINYLKNMFNYKSLVYIFVLFLTANIEVMGVRPFIFVMLAVSGVFKINAILPLAVSGVSFFVFRLDMPHIVNFLICYVVYEVLSKLISVEGINKKYSEAIKLSLSLVVSTIVTSIIYKIAFSVCLQNMLLVVAAYPVFIWGISAIINLPKSIILSTEELISLLVVVVLILSPFANVTIYGLNLVKIVLTIFMLVIGWKNNYLVGIATGTIAGLLYIILTNSSSLILVSFALTGFVAGLLNKSNKFILSLVFVLGNTFLVYIYKGNENLIINLEEIIIATLGILILPKKFMLKLEDVIGDVLFLTRGYENQLGPATDIRDRLSKMGDVLSDLSNMSTETTAETKEETAEIIRRYIQDYKKNSCIGCKDKFNCLDSELDLISKHIAELLETNQPINSKMIPTADCDKSEEIITNIEDIYTNIKLMRIVRAKENENSIKLAEEYKEMSKVIKNMSKDIVKKMQENPKQKQVKEDLKHIGYTIYEDILNIDGDMYTYEFITDIITDIDKAKKDIQSVVSNILGKKMVIKLILNSSSTERSKIKLVPMSKFVVKAAVKQIRKADSAVNGDSYIVTELKDNSKVIAISDGMGSGAKSKEVSSMIISMIEKFTTVGFDKEQVLNIVNKIVRLKESGDISASLDMCVINEQKESLEIIKLGSAPSYIISDNEVYEVNESNFPMGLLSTVKYNSFEKEVKKGDLVIMMSDGAGNDITKKVLEEIILKNLSLTETTLMESIMEILVGNQNKIILDDITVIVANIK